MEASLSFSKTQLRSLSVREELYSIYSHNNLKLNRKWFVPVFPDLSQCVEAFDVILKGPVSDYLNSSQAIGSEVEKHVSGV